MYFFSFDISNPDNIKTILIFLFFIGVLIYNFFNIKKQSPEEYEQETDTTLDESYSDNNNYKNSAPYSGTSTYNTSSNYTYNRTSLYGKSSYSKDNPLFKNGNSISTKFFSNLFIIAILILLILIILYSTADKFENIGEILKSALKLIGLY